MRLLVELLVIALKRLVPALKGLRASLGQPDSAPDRRADGCADPGDDTADCRPGDGPGKAGRDDAPGLIAERGADQGICHLQGRVPRHLPQPCLAQALQDGSAP